jgi:hypothetical protein
MFHNQSVDHLADSLKLIQVYVSFKFQVTFMKPCQNSCNIEKNSFLQFSFPKYLKFDKLNIQQEEIVSHMPSTTLMDLHKTLQPIANFENMQVLITPIIKDKLLALHILTFKCFIKIYDYRNSKLKCSMTFDLESILHQTSSTIILGG